MLTYEQALASIHEREGRPWRSGLDRMRAFVERAGLSKTLDGRGYIHIAGTNGKGTTTAFVESILRHQGWRAGAFFSPYVVDYRERIQAGGGMIAPEELAALVQRLLPVADAMDTTPFGGATKFELEVALGLAYWEERACDWVALEVGLGGRLDATNVVIPRACVITSIGLDHTTILGDTVEAIAAEKAGIIKPGIPVIVGELPPRAFAIIERIAAEQGAPLWKMGDHILLRKERQGWTVEMPSFRLERLRPSLGGEWTPHNMALAIAACVAAGVILEVGDPLLQGVQAAWLPGRHDLREIQGRRVIFDGAHNADAARALRNVLKGPRIVLVTNMLAGHEVEAFYRQFQDRAVQAEVAPIASPRAMTVEEAVARLETVGIPARGHSTTLGALETALASEPDSTVVVTGSNYLVGEVLRLLPR